MRKLSTILIIFFLTSVTITVGQTKTKGYQIVFGKDTFQTSTTIEKNEFDNNSLREYSYLFKNQSQIILIPRRIDKIWVRDITNPSESKLKIDTVDQIVVNKVVDTISKAELNYIIKSEIKIYDRKLKLKFDEAQFETIQPNGKISFTIDLQRPRINEGKHATESISALETGGYLILGTIWFYDLKGDRHEIECNIAWMLE